MRNRRRHPAGRRSNARMPLLLIGAGILALIFLIDAQIRPVIESMTAYQAKVLAVRAMNEAMARELQKGSYSYGDLVAVTRGPDGEVKSIEADMAAINGLKTRMGEGIVSSLELGENRRISLPLGTLMGNQFTSGRGPKIEIRVVPAGAVSTRIYNQFASAGINQTLHQIMLEATVQMAAVLPGYSVQTETVTNYCIAETIIVGGIPQGYASFIAG